VQSYNNAHQPTTTTTTVIEEEETLVTPELFEVVYEDNTVTYTDTSVNQMTYYSGRSGCKGASGRTLLNDYSCACNSIPLGTIIHIESSDGSVNGDYRVDDRGGMSDNVVDIFYNSYDNVPSSFRFNGRVSCTVWIVE
jgi:3D (Asp-Asp-Asp) domain-containing protein